MVKETRTVAKAAPRRPDTIADHLIDVVVARLGSNKRVRRTLPLAGRIHIDRQLPFLCVYRRPPADADDGARRLVTSEAAYIFATGLRRFHPGLRKLVSGVARAMGEQFGAFLLVEIWAARLDAQDKAGVSVTAEPAFKIFAPRDERAETIVETLKPALEGVSYKGRSALVDLIRGSHTSAPGMAPLLTTAQQEAANCLTLGIEIKPIFRDAHRDRVFPIVLRDLEREFTRALRPVFYEFAQTQTTHRPRHFHGMGRRAMVKAVWAVDKRLAEVSSRFDFLLQVTPANALPAWRQFKSSDFRKAPTFRYRPLPLDPILLKRKLFSVPIERLEDPAIRRLFLEKLDELDRRLTMLGDINTPRFVHSSVQLYGDIDPKLVRLARRILDTLPSRTRDESKKGALTPAEFASLAETELGHYRQVYPELKATVQLRDDVTGLMASRGNLLVSRHSKIPRARADALLQHEIGTHIVTYYNGRAQPFRQLYSGLAGYDATQEGLAVFAEFLVGGLTRPRLRLLAARVLAAHRMLGGAGFVETFRELDDSYDFERRTAFTTVLRVYRGGGLTKDAVYLQGLVDMLKYLADGGDLEPLLVGKMALEHVPIIEELLWRRVLHPPPLRPRFLDWPGAADRMARARRGLSVFDLVTAKAGA